MKILLRRPLAAFVLSLLAAAAAVPAFAGGGKPAADDEDDDDKADSAANRFAKLFADANVGDAVNGEKLFRMNCAVCHGWNARGAGPFAAKLTVKPSNLHDGTLMNQFDDDGLRKLIEKGGKGRPTSKSMPGFGAGLDNLAVNDLIAYVRTLHPRVETYFPEGRWFLSKRYTIDEYGKGRMEKAYGRAVKPAELEIDVITVFNRMDLAKNFGAPILVPQEPQKVDRLRKQARIGYLMFTLLDLPKFGPTPVAIALDNNGAITALQAVDAPPADEKKLNAMLGAYAGKGRRAPRYDAVKKEFKVRDKNALAYLDPVFRLWVRALEASFMCEREEKERTLLDEEFRKHKKKDEMPESDFKVKQ